MSFINKISAEINDICSILKQVFMADAIIIVFMADAIIITHDCTCVNWKCPGLLDNTSRLLLVSLLFLLFWLLFLVLFKARARENFLGVILFILNVFGLSFLLFWLVFLVFIQKIFARENFLGNPSFFKRHKAQGHYPPIFEKAQGTRAQGTRFWGFFSSYFFLCMV